MRVDLAVAQAAGHPVATEEDAHRLFASLAAAAVPVGSYAYLIKRMVLTLLAGKGIKSVGGSMFEAVDVSMSSLGVLVADAARKSPAVDTSYALFGRKLLSVAQALTRKGWIFLTHDPGALPYVRLDAKQLLTRLPQLTAKPVPAPGAPAVPRIITTGTEAAAAVQALLGEEAVAMDCEGDLQQGGSVALVQLAAAGGPAYLFDLHAMSAQARQEAVQHLGRLLAAERPLKVMHDCRRDAEALRYVHGLQCAGLWDTQVALGLLQFLHSVGAGASDTTQGVDGAADLPARGPAGLNAMLQHCGLPVNPLKNAMHRRMDEEADLFTKRPLGPDVVQYAVADVEHLLAARRELSARLGPAAAARVARLSAAYSEWFFDPSDRSCTAASSGAGGAATTGGASYAAALRLPLGEDLSLSFGPLPNCRAQLARLVPSQGDAAGASHSNGWQQQQGKDWQGADSGQPNAHRRLTSFLSSIFSRAKEAADPNGMSAGSQAHEDTSVLDKESLLVLQLFPPRVQGAITQLLMRLHHESMQNRQQLRNDAPADTHGSDAQAAASAAAAGVSVSNSEASETLAAGTAAGRASLRLVEVVVDVDRLVRIRLSDRSSHCLDIELSMEDALAALAAAKGRLHLDADEGGDLFYSDNRAGIPKTLHRVSAMRDRAGRVVGLTYRVGRHVPGVGSILLDVLASLARGHSYAQDAGFGPDPSEEAPLPSLLLLGPPGVGKTTLLRDVAAVLSTNFRTNVIVVDTSNEIAGDGTTPHPCIGNARRMQVPRRERQHDTLLEVVQNHNPDVVIVDEITNTHEVAAARTIANRGVVLVGTAHGRDLRTLMLNHELNPLVGGLTAVVQGDQAAAQRSGGRKTVSERRGAPAFSNVVEVLGGGHVRLHLNTARSVDALLAGREPVTQLRWVAEDGSLRARLEGPKAETQGAGNGGMRGAVRKAAAAAAGRAANGEQQERHWFQQLLELAELY